MSDFYKPRPDRLFRIRFGLRTVFILVTVLGVWLGVQAKWIRDRHRALEGADMTDYFDPYMTPASWSLRLFGELGITGLAVERDQVGDYQALFPEAAVVEYVETEPVKPAPRNARAKRP